MKYSPEELIELTTESGGRFRVGSVEESFKFCTQRARAHYENFPVASVLLPRVLRPHFYSVYCFARLADDIADEPGLAENVRLDRLNALARLLRQAEQIDGNPVFTALAHTRQQYDLPLEPFERLLQAFRMDSQFSQPRTFDDLEHYCQYSANPVGELVLRLYRLHSPLRQDYADALCTGLQLANFWQDLSVDRQGAYQHRITLPADVLERYGITPEEILLNTVDGKRLLACLHDVYAATRQYFDKGQTLLAMIPSLRLRAELALTLASGKRILRKTEAAGRTILERRPRLQKTDIAPIFSTSLLLFCASFFSTCRSLLSRLHRPVVFNSNSSPLRSPSNVKAATESNSTEYSA
jgi:squalene synthase HpnC